MSLAYSFESNLSFQEAVEMFHAIDNWVGKPNLHGKWLVRDNDRWGDYLSCSAYHAADRSIVKTVCLFFDTHPKQVTLRVSRDPKLPATGSDLKQVWLEHQSYVLHVLLPSIGARNVQQSDFER